MCLLVSDSSAGTAAVVGVAQAMYTSNGCQQRQLVLGATSGTPARASFLPRRSACDMPLSNREFNNYPPHVSIVETGSSPLRIPRLAYNMGSFDNLLISLDEGLAKILGDWDTYSTSIVALLVAFFAYQVFSRRDPDTHPMLLARQAQPFPLRYPGESPVYRSQSSPHGMELNTGLNVRDSTTNKWAKGRDGDLRDVWRRVASGQTDKEGNVTGGRGKILTVLGTEKVVEHRIGRSWNPTHQ